MKTSSSSPKRTNLYSRALQLAVTNGYSIMPVGLDKRPLLRSWKEYQTAAASDATIEKWWTLYPHANIGIITGEVSGITVIDVDTYKGATAEQFPPTFTVRTGNGGLHLYYKYHPGLSISANAYPNHPGVDIRSDGGFVVGPYSVTNYSDPHTHEHKGGEYTIIDDRPLAPFPHTLFPETKKRRKLSSLMGVATGGRNDSIASFAGKLLRSTPEEEWESEVWPAVERANLTYSPPLPRTELRATFESIRTKELAQRASLIVSPFQLDATDTDGEGESINIPIRKNRAGAAYNNMANVLAVLKHHPYYKGTIKYNEFRQEIEYNGKPFEDGDIIKIQYFMQTEAGLNGISSEAVASAVQHYANQNKYDEAQDWVRALKWDGIPRLHEWVSKATHVPQDAYHAGIGSQWFAGIIRRIMVPGSTFDYVLVLVGAQGIGKTSLFRIIGGPWYKSYTGAIDNKDFYLALRGAVIMDLDEGAALSRSDAIKIKSIITETHDEYRAPYGRLMKKYPRRFVFSMSTNDTEPFRDITGNRRYWTIDGAQKIDFAWLETNRDQLYAEAYDAFLNGTILPSVPFSEAAERQEAHLPEDSWTDLVTTHIQKNEAYRTGSSDFFTTILDTYTSIFPDESVARVGKAQEMRITNIFKKALGLEKTRTRVEGQRQIQWKLSAEKMAELQATPARDTRDEFDKYEKET